MDRTYKVVRLETKFSPDSGHDFSLVGSVSGEQGTTELNLDEELRVKDGRSGVEGSSGNLDDDLAKGIYARQLHYYLQ